jgi:TonB family protein
MSILDGKRSDLEDRVVAVDHHAAYKQRRQMLLALATLCVALVLVLIKDWQFWFPAETAIETTPATSPKKETAKLEPNKAPLTADATTNNRARPKQTPPPQAPAIQAAEAVGPSITATQRKVLPPLEVEVVSGGKRRPLQPKNNTVKVDLQENTQPIQQASSTTVEPMTKPATDASTSVHLSPETEKMVARPVEPSYPLLAKQMKVQGAVVLQALIGKAGSIDDLHVLSGPAILSSAAMEAVKQWRFKPYFQEGRAVETQARITVNFTISTF